MGATCPCISAKGTAKDPWKSIETSIGKLTYGADFYVDFVDSYTTSITNGVTTQGIQGPIADDALYGQYGFFADDQIEVSTRGHLDVGLRYTHVDVDADKVRDPQTGTRTAIDET